MQSCLLILDGAAMLYTFFAVFLETSPSTQRVSKVMSVVLCMSLASPELDERSS